MADTSKNIGLAILAIVLGACGLFFPGQSKDKATPFPPDNVEVVVPQSEKVAGWLLSPAGDKIAYTGYFEDNSKQVLLFPATHTKQTLDCEGFIWLDNDTLGCTWQNKIVVVQAEGTITPVSLKKVNALEVDLPGILRAAGRIYHLEWPDYENKLLVRDTAQPPAPDRNYLIEGIADITATLQAYPVITIPKPTSIRGEKIYSPNKKYYFVFSRLARDRHALTTFDSDNDNLLSEFIGPEIHYFIVGGWAADSSGVYFEIDTAAPLSAEAEKLEQILKLKVPQ